MNISALDLGIAIASQITQSPMSVRDVAKLSSHTKEELAELMFLRFKNDDLPTFDITYRGYRVRYEGQTYPCEKPMCECPYAQHHPNNPCGHWLLVACGMKG